MTSFGGLVRARGEEREGGREVRGKVGEDIKIEGCQETISYKNVGVFRIVGGFSTLRLKIVKIPASEKSAVATTNTAF
jgi:hypothetical protein